MGEYVVSNRREVTNPLSAAGFPLALRRGSLGAVDGAKVEPKVA